MLTTPGFDNLISVYYTLSILFFFSPIIIYYFKSKAFQINLKKIHFLILLGYSLLGEILFLGIEFISSESDRGLPQGPILQTPSEFIIVNLIFLFFYYLFQSYSWNIIYAHEIIIPTETKPRNLVPILKKTNDLMGAKLYRSSDQTDAEYFVPGSYFTRFDQYIQQLDEPKGFKVILLNSSRNLRLLSFFQTLLILPLILVRSYQIPVQNIPAADYLTLTLQFSATPTKIDVVWWFLLVGILFLFYGLTVGSASENVLLKFEETFKKAKVDQVLNIGSFNINKPDLSLDGAKDKLTGKKDSVTNQLEDQKRRRVDEVMGILNPKKEEVKQMDPDVLRLEALIFTVRTVLQATPSHRKITLTELNDYFNKKTKTTPEELESIVFGLIQRKEVEGNYNIWDKVYSGGTPARRFVDKTLEFAENIQGEINTIKVKADGSVEFYFKPDIEEEQEETEKKESTSDNVTKDSSEEENEDESEEIDKFDSF